MRGTDWDFDTPRLGDGSSAPGLTVAVRESAKSNETRGTLARDADGCPWRVTMVMPAFNEGEVIRHVVTRSRTALRELTGDFENIVVDDGQYDDTGSNLEITSVHK